MMILTDSWQAMEGLSAVFKDDVFLAVDDYVFKFDFTAWDWVHLVGGVVQLLAGFGVLSGMLAARIVGITVPVSGHRQLPCHSVQPVLVPGHHRGGRPGVLGLGALRPRPDERRAVRPREAPHRALGSPGAGEVLP
jgi:hypothetical protein